MGKPVASEIVVELPKGLGQVRIEAAEEEIRRTLGAEIEFGRGALFFNEGKGGQEYVGADGVRFQAAPGFELRRVDAVLDHPASGFGRAGLDKAAKVIEAVQAGLPARRVIYGAAGHESHSDMGRLASRMWSERAYAELKVMSNLAAKGSLEAMAFASRPKAV